MKIIEKNPFEDSAIMYGIIEGPYIGSCAQLTTLIPTGVALYCVAWAILY